MKYFLSLLLSVSLLFCVAQRQYKPVWQGTPTSESARTVTDTMAPWGSTIVHPNLFESQNGGYLVGVNGYHDKQAAQIFIPQFPVTVTGMVIWFGAKHLTSGNPNSVVTFKLFALDSNNLSNAVSSNAKGPGTVLSSVTKSVTSINADTSIANGLNYISFPSAINIDSATGFVLGFDVTNVVTGDTLGLITTQDGDAGNKDFSIQQWSNGSWNSFLDPNNWDTDLDLYILAITEHEPHPNFLGEINTTNAFTVFPNPAHDYFMLASTLKDAEIKVTDAAGRTVLNSKPETGNLKFNCQSWSRGIYFIELTNNNGETERRKLVLN